MLKKKRKIAIASSNSSEYKDYNFPGEIQKLQHVDSYGGSLNDYISSLTELYNSVPDEHKDKVCINFSSEPEAYSDHEHVVVDVYYYRDYTPDEENLYKDKQKAATLKQKEQILENARRSAEQFGYTLVKK